MQRIARHRLQDVGDQRRDVAQADLVNTWARRKGLPERRQWQTEGPARHLHHVAGKGSGGNAQGGDKADHALATNRGGLGAAFGCRNDKRDDAVLGPPDVLQLRVRLEQDRAARKLDALKMRCQAAEIVRLKRGEQAVA